MTKSNALFINRTLKSIADSFIKVFSTVLIYKLTGNLSFAFIFLTANFITSIIMFAFFGKIFQKLGAFSLIIYIIPIVLESVCFSLLNITLMLVILIGVFDAISNMIYFASINTIFANLDDKTNVAKFESAASVGSIIFSILSSYLLGNYINSVIFLAIVVSALYILSGLPIFFYYKEINSCNKNIPVIDKKEFYNFNKPYVVYFMLIGLLSMFVDAILPLYLYVYGLSFTAVGIVVALSYLVRIGANYFGVFLQKKGVVKQGIIVNSIILFCSLLSIMLIKNNLAIYILTIIFTFSKQCIANTIYKYFLVEQKNMNYTYKGVIVKDLYQYVLKVIAVTICIFYANFTILFVIGLIAIICTCISALYCNKHYNLSFIIQK